jgi:ubiquinone/menaquinone biosynthesis C-methylase UbiE
MDNRKTFFDVTANYWDEMRSRNEMEYILNNVVEWFEIKKGHTILDVGTGTGVLLPFIWGKATEGKLVGIDFSYKMLEKAKKWTINKDISVINGVVGAIPFKTESFDRVICFSAFPHFPDKQRALSEMTRVLKPGGLLIVAHLHSTEEIAHLHSRVGEAVKMDHLPEPELMRNLMTDCGLMDVYITNEPGKYLARGRKT